MTDTQMNQMAAGALALSPLSEAVLHLSSEAEPDVKKIAAQLAGFDLAPQPETAEDVAAWAEDGLDLALNLLALGSLLVGYTQMYRAKLDGWAAVTKDL